MLRLRKLITDNRGIAAGIRRYGTHRRFSPGWISTDIGGFGRKYSKRDLAGSRTVASGAKVRGLPAARESAKARL